MAFVTPPVRFHLVLPPVAAARGDKRSDLWNVESSFSARSKTPKIDMPRIRGSRAKSQPSAISRAKRRAEGQAASTTRAPPIQSPAPSPQKTWRVRAKTWRVRKNTRVSHATTWRFRRITGDSELGAGDWQIINQISSIINFLDSLPPSASAVRHSEAASFASLTPPSPLPFSLITPPVRTLCEPITL